MTDVVDHAGNPEVLDEQPDESALITRAQNGDDEAFGELVRMYQARLRGFASRYIDNSFDVFEIVQDAFLNAYRHLDRFDVDRAFYPWLRVICHNLVLNYFRARRKTRNVQLQLVDDALLDRISSLGQVDDEAAVLHIEALQKCIDQLPESQRDLVRTRYHDSAAVKDIADTEHSSPTSISMRLMRIRKKLRKCMDERLSRQQI